MDSVIFFIKEQYFIERKHYQKMLDPCDSEKQSHRAYICIKVHIDNNIFYLPLRNRLTNDVKPYGRIGHLVPSFKRPEAGIDFRYALIINDSKYIETDSMLNLPNSQINKINSDYNIIKNEFQIYLKGYKRAVLKNRLEREPLYRESSLINFNKELGLNIISKKQPSLA